MDTEDGAEQLTDEDKLDTCVEDGVDGTIARVEDADTDKEPEADKEDEEVDDEEDKTDDED